jgi:ABC-type transport system substrate-binding protein
LKEWEKGSRIVLERNPQFHTEFYPTQTSNEYLNRGWLADAGKPLPFLDRIVFDLFVDKAPAWRSFIRGKTDALRIPRDNLSQAITNQVNLAPELEAKGVRLSIEASVAFNYLIFNMRDPILGRNRFLRQAISSAIDREKWIELFTGSTGQKMTSVLPPDIPGRPVAPALKFDYAPARARALLKKAGYPGGRGLPPLTLDLRGTDGYSRKLGEFLTEELAAFGIHLKIVLHGLEAFLEGARTGQFQIAFGNSSMDYPDAENLFALLYGPNAAPGPNLASFNQPRLNSWYDQISRTKAGPERTSLIHSMDALVQDEVPWVLGYYSSRYLVTQPWVLNYRNNVLILNKYKYVRVDRALKTRYLEEMK